MMKFINTYRNIYLTILLLTILSVILLYSDPRTASNLVIVPDSTEYALAAHCFATTGEYKILVDGQWRPPRYPPWFSILIITPAYRLAGLEPGNAIYPIIFSGVLGVLIAFFLGKKIGGLFGGIFASLMLLALPVYRMYSKYVMTDVPITVLALITCLIYLQLKSKTTPLTFLFAGFLIAVAASMRPVWASMIFPFLFFLIHSNNKKTFQKILFLLVPLFCTITASMAYNTYVFGHPFRTGYHYWTSVPYDYLNLTFSLSYVPVNLILLWKSKIIHFATVVFIVCASNYWLIRLNSNSQSSLDSMRWLIEFALIGTGPIMFFHLIYFYPEPRFYLPIIAIAAIFTGGIMGRWINRYPILTLLGVLGIIFVSQFFTKIEGLDKPEHMLNRRSAVSEIVRLTLADSLIISTIEPAYIEYFTAKESQRRIIPLSRSIEYANKLITPKKIPNPDPAPKNWQDHRCAGLINGGAREAVKATASEQIDFITQQIVNGHKVYVNTTHVQENDKAILREMEKRFVFIPLTKDLFELQNRH